MARRSLGFRPDAPVVVRQEREISADPRRVWEVLSEVRAWSAWHRRIGFATLRGELSAGTPLQWACDGMKFASVLAEVEAPGGAEQPRPPEESSRCGRLAWTLRTFGARGYLRWTLTPGGNGGTRVTLEESWDGLPVRFLRRTLERTLASSRADWIDRLAERSETRGQSASGHQRGK